MNADLHVHTKESDGSLSVEEVLLTASNSGINILAITDHETTSGVEKAQRIAEFYGIEIIPGVELNTVYKDEEVHLLGYFKDIHHQLLQDKLKEIRRDRSHVTWDIVQKLKKNGIILDWSEIEKTASRDGVICKTHIMYVLRNSTFETGDKVDWNHVAAWFKPGGIAYVPYNGNPFRDAVDLIFTCGGIPVLAHPGLIHNKSIINELLSYKPIGLEVFYGYWDKKDETIAYFKGIAGKNAILSTGGSDYHGFFSPVGIGQVDVPDQCVTDLKKYLQID